MGDVTTIERAAIERDNWQHKYESEVEAKQIYLRQSAGNPHQIMMQDYILL